MRFGSIKAAAVVVAGLGLSTLSGGLAGSASADSVSGATGASCSGGQCTVKVQYSGTAAPPAGAPQAVASVPPVCHYESPRSPQEMYAYMKGQYNTPYYSGQSGLSLFGPQADFEKAAKDPALADSTWYVLDCSIDLTDKQAIAYAGESEHTMGSDAPYARLARLFPPGQPPPPPLVDPKTLRDAAYDSMTIPDPDIQRNPELTGSAATLVNLDTMFWADRYPGTWDITASVGPVSATVVAKSDDYVLTSPAGGTTCTQEQFTTPYTGGEGDPDGCQFPFTRSSHGGSFPVQTTATWRTSWTGVPAPQAAEPLAPLTTSTTVEVPVQEAQALVDSTDGGNG